MDFASKNPEISTFLNDMHSMSGIEKDNVGEEVQRLSVIKDLPKLMVTDEEGCMHRVIPKIIQCLSNASTEFHIEAARIFSIMLEKKTIGSNTFAQTLLPSIILHVDNRDQVASNAWLETLQNATDLLPLEIVKGNIVNVAITKGQISQNVTHRIASCKLLGKICARFDSNFVKKDILPVVLSLCQDVNESVRATICSQLHLVAKGVPPDMIKSSLMPILVELGRDETVQVRVEAIETIVKVLPFLSQELIKVSVIPLIKKIFEQAMIAVDDTLVMVSKQFGSLCIGLESILTPAEKLWLVTYYHSLSHMGVPQHGPKRDIHFPSQNMDRTNVRFIECRQNCAYNFPAMTKFSVSNPELLDKIYPSFCDFTTDPYYMVRKTIGAGMHEVSRLLGKNNRVVKNQVMTLLWDNMEEVLMGIVPRLSVTIEMLILSGVLGQDQDGNSYELGRGLLQCDKTIRDKSHNWRLYTDFITQLEAIVKCLPSDYIYSHFVSNMFDKMHRARPLPCRIAAARTLLVFLRYNIKNNQRQEIRSRLQSEFCLSSSCYKRMLYLRLCNTAREVFSRAYFKEHFFYPLLSRSDDKVPNNRLLLIRQFPSLKAMILMPSEKKYLQTLETCVRSMAMAEKDKDVTAELKSLIHRMDKIETLSDGVVGNSAEDVEDRRKFEEESKLANAIMRPGAAMLFAPAAESRRAVAGPPSRVLQPPANQPNSLLPSLQQTQITKPVPSKPPNVVPPSPSSTGSTSSSVMSAKVDKGASYVRPPNPPLPPSTPSSARPVPSSIQSFTNTTNNLKAIKVTTSSHKTNNDLNCVCYAAPYFRSDNLRNLNLLALLDTSIFNSKQSFSESLRQKLSEASRIKVAKSSKHSMEISWLNLETDLKNELFALMKSRQIHGDRNLKEKSKFLSDFRNYNESTLSKFINEDREYKETIYNVTGVGGYEKTDVNFFEDRLKFFERKIKLEDSKYNNTGDCSCFELTPNRAKFIDHDDYKRFSYFSKKFEEEFYRDAGVKAYEVIEKKLSSVSARFDKPVSQILSPKPSTLTSSKRRTWFGIENTNQGTVKLESITGFKGKEFERKKSETLPARDSLNLKKLGIGPRSKSFVLPSTLIYSDKPVNTCQSTKVVFDTRNGGDKELKVKEPNKINKDTNRLGVKLKPEDSSSTDKRVEKPLVKTKIPVGRVVNSVSPGSSRSTSPCVTKDKGQNGVKPQANGTKKIPVVVSRKSMLIQSNSIKNEVKNNRRSLDSTKISLANLDKGVEYRKKNDKILGKGKRDDSRGVGIKEEKAEGETTINSSFSKLPVRRPKPDK